MNDYTKDDNDDGSTKLKGGITKGREWTDRQHCIGLPSKGLWSLSHRKDARIISQMEAELDKSKLSIFDLGEGLI